MVNVVCLGCRQPLEMDGPRPANIINLPDCSVIVVQHAKQATCPRCGCVTIAVMSASVAMAAHPLPDEHPDILIAPAGLRLN